MLLPFPLVPTRLADSSMSYGMLFVTGLLMGFHHRNQNPLRAILSWVKTWVSAQPQKIHTEKSQLPTRKAKEKVQKPIGSWTNFGCGGRTRTYDLRVMSPTSFQLLYSAI